MRNTLICIAVLATSVMVFGSGCATNRCLERYSTMPSDQTIRRDGELLQQLVERRRAAAQELQSLAEGSSERGDLEFSIQAWEMAIRLVAQLQNLSRREGEASSLEEHRELATNIRCAASVWLEEEGHVVATRDGQELLTYQRELEEHFGETGRPTDSQLSAIIEGREIYRGPVEEDVGVPEQDEGTGPESGEGEGGDEQESDEEEETASSAVDELLGSDDDDDEEEE